MKTYVIESAVLAEQPAAVVRTTIAVAGIAGWIGGAYRATAAYLSQEGAGPAGPPFARFHCVGENRFEVEAGFPSTRVVPYDEMTPAYDGLLAWIRDHGGEPAGDAWEVY